jgi:hypothetical protein
MTINFIKLESPARNLRTVYLRAPSTSSKFIHVNLRKKFFRLIQRSDDFRAVNVARDGGFNLDDAVLLAKYRSAFKDLLG